MRLRLLLIAPLLLAGAISLGQTFKTFSGKVVGVADGDTISVMRDGAAAKVRLHGIDCPESNQAFGAKAKKFTSDLVFGKVVKVESRSTGTDKYGRLIGLVTTADGKVLNHELVKAGLAWWYRQYAKDDKELEKLEAAAKKEKAGLWADKDPIAPWDFRHGGATAKTQSQPKRTEAPAKSAKESSATVYITRTGSKYHLDGCRYLRSSRIPISKKDAIRQGYEACSICAPVSLSLSRSPFSPAASLVAAARTHRQVPQLQRPQPVLKVTATLPLKWQLRRSTSLALGASITVPAVAI